MAPQELIVSACSSEATSSANPGRAYVPSIQVHDLLTNSTVHAFKTSMSTPNCLSHVGSQNGTGGAIFAVQEGKAIVNVWAWQKVCRLIEKSHSHNKTLTDGTGSNAYQATFAREVILLQRLSKWLLGCWWIPDWSSLLMGGKSTLVSCTRGVCPDRVACIWSTTRFVHSALPINHIIDIYARLTNAPFGFSRCFSPYFPGSEISR